MWQASAFSILVFTGSAQFAAVGIIGTGGAAVPAIAAGLLLNLRSLAFGVAMAPSLTGPRWKRAIWAQLMIDESTAIATAQADHRWRRYAYVWSGTVLFVTWNLSTLVGAVVLSSTGGVVSDWGLDAAIPATFLALLWPRLSRSDQRRTALAGAIIALALVPVAHRACRSCVPRSVWRSVGVRSWMATGDPTMTATMVLIGLGVGTYLLKVAAPLLLGGRRLPPVVARLTELLPAALLAALVVVSTVVIDRAIVLDARMAGLAAAAVALALRAPFVAVIVVAAAAAAVTRML